MRISVFGQAFKKIVITKIDQTNAGAKVGQNLKFLHHCGPNQLFNIMLLVPFLSTTIIIMESKKKKKKQSKRNNKITYLFIHQVFH